VDSSEWAFYQATQSAFEEVSSEGVWQLLEPVMAVEVNSPVEFSSQVYSLVSGRSAPPHPQQRLSNHHSYRLLRV